MEMTDKLIQMREHAQEKLADKYTGKGSKYRSYMQALEKSPLARVKSLTALDFANLGRQLEKWDEYKSIQEDDGNIASLGTYPNVALDALTVNYGASPINVIAATQPIDEVQGIVYFRQLVAQNARGNVSVGDTLLDSLGAPTAFPQGFASDTVQNAQFVNDGGGTASYSSVNLAGSAEFGKPINPQTIVLRGSVVFSTGTATFANIKPDPTTGAFSQMVAAGSAYVGVHGTVNFTLGQVTLVFTATPTGQASMFANYQTIQEAGADLQKAILKLTSKPILARFFSLKSTIGMAESYMLRKRFGMSAEEEIAKDLTVAINNEIVNTAVNLINSNIPSGNNSVSWIRQPQSGVSYFEHQMTLLNALAEVDAQIVKSAGRGNVNCWIVGRQAANIMSLLPGFTKLFDDNSFGPHIYGQLNGVTVVRVPYSSVLDDNAVLGIYKGSDAFDAPVVYAPYMPLIVTNTLPMGFNPLQQQRACLVWAGLDPLVSNLSTKLTIDETSFNFGSNS